MITRTFITKCNTIVKDNDDNFGLNPIGCLNYGLITSRVLLYFDITKIKGLVDDETYSIEKCKHSLKLYNCASFDDVHFNVSLISNDANGEKKRATSFTIIMFEVPKDWDRGVGFDNSNDIWVRGDNAESQMSCNWFQCKEGLPWDNEGIYTSKQLSEEYEKFKNGQKSIIITEQHFDYGNELFDFDITDYVNKLISGEKKNHGVCLAFVPELEESLTNFTRYVGFFTDKTNTFFEPYLETRCSNVVTDSRNNFVLNKTNKLYLFANIGNELLNLDEMPVCKIDDVEYPVVKQSKGVYYAEVKLSGKEYSPDMILSDEWSNLKYNGEDIDDVAMEFVTKQSQIHFSIGNPTINSKVYTVLLNGISDSEKIIQKNKRTITVNFRIPYTREYAKTIINPMYRLYVKNGNKEVDVIDWDDINIGTEECYFTLDLNELIPQEYHFDIKMNDIVYKDELKFRLVDNSTRQIY